MKKITALILAFVMLGMMFSIDTMVNAAEVTPEPFYAVNFQEITVESPYLYEATSIYTPQTTDPDNPRVPSYKNVTNVKQIAQMIKEDFNSRPDGTRYLQYNMLAASRAVAEDIIYMDRPVEITKDWLTSFLSEYKSIGGKLDGIIVDLEYSAAESYNIWKNEYKGTNPDIYKNIVDDSRYATRIRPMLEERGFVFWNDDSTHPEIWGINDDVSSKNEKYAMCRTVWDNMINDLLADAINESTYEPLIQYYPDAVLSDYQRSDFKGWLKHVNDYGTVRIGNVSKAGNASNFNSYTNRIANGFYGTVTNGSITNPVYTKVPGYNNAVYGSEPFYMTLWDANLFKTMLSATDTGLTNAWVGGYTGYWSKDTGNICTTAETPYYSESLFHIAMLNQQPIMGYINQSYEKYDANDPNNEYNTCLNVLSDVLAELTKVAGYADRKPILTPATWNGNYVLSGMYAGGRNIWRITPNTEVKTLEAFKIQDKDPTFSIDGLTITFPDGKIIADGDVREVGTCGYWIETPANVMPVITSEADRYSKYPSFSEDFEQYTVGSTFTSSTALPKACWEVSTGLGGSSLKVQSDGNDNALALTSSSYGTTTVKNVKLPQNITAGDSYAKQQVWEVSFTLPSNLSTSAEIKLLTANGDGGIMIKNGKVSYDKSGSYQELAGVSLSAGVKYTVKREVDFRTAGAFKGSYYIYNSAGNLVGEAKNIPMKSITLPVTNIGFSSKYASNNVVLIDDYKLYPMGVTTDFEIYDAESGYKLDNVNQVRTEDTAYRLSWMNTTNEDKIAYVHNAQTGAVVNTVWMAAGQDGVATGVVTADDTNVQLAVEVIDDTAIEIQGAPWIAFGSDANAKTPVAGSSPIYFKTSDTGVVTEGGSEDDYNIKLSYSLGGKPTITLNNANIVSDYAGINIGKDAASTDLHGYPVDIVVRGNNSITTTNDAAAINSYATGDITIQGVNGGRLNLSCDSNTQTVICTAGNIRLEEANISLIESEAGSFISSKDIAIAGGSLQIEAGLSGMPGNAHVLNAQGNIIVENGAKVTIWNKGPNSIFSADNIYLKKSTVKVAAPHANGSIFDPNTLLTFANYTSAVSTTMPTVSWDPATGVTITAPTTTGEYNKTDYTTYKYFSISPS